MTYSKNPIRLLRLVPGFRGHAAPRLPPPARGPADPNEPYIFKPVPLPDDGQGVVTLDHLYHLSRSL